MKIKFFLSLLALVLLSACTSDLPKERKAFFIGNPDAKVVIEEFSDFQCPACAQISPQVEAIARKYSDQVKFVYRHFPLSYHPYSFQAAEAAECAGDQGKFFEYGNLLFANQKDLPEDRLKSLAVELGLNAEVFNACLENEVHRGDVLFDLREGQLKQIPGTPSLFVNGQMIRFSGAETFEAYVLSLTR